MAQPDLGLAHIKELAFPLAPLEEQQEVVRRVQTFLKTAIGDKLRRALESQEGLSLKAQTCETQTG